MEQDEKAYTGVEAEEPQHITCMSGAARRGFRVSSSCGIRNTRKRPSSENSNIWLNKEVPHQCYHGFMKATQKGNMQWESRTHLTLHPHLLSNSHTVHVIMTFINLCMCLEVLSREAVMLSSMTSGDLTSIANNKFDLWLQAPSLPP